MTTNKRMSSAEKAAALYDQAYAKRYRAHDESLPSSVPSQELAAWLQGICGQFARPIDVLDLGCGTGRYFWALTGARQIVGVDASPAMLAEALHPYREADITARVTLIEGDLLKLDFAAASFDLVYSVGVLAEHAPLTSRLVELIHDWLVPDGRFAFTAVHPESPSVPATLKRRLAKMAAPIAPGSARRALRERLRSHGMYADESFVREIAEPYFVVERMDRFASEAHDHVRAVLRKRS
jgi:SAM-dependent methyltransferase